MASGDLNDCLSVSGKCRSARVRLWLWVSNHNVGPLHLPKPQRFGQMVLSAELPVDAVELSSVQLGQSCYRVKLVAKVHGGDGTDHDGCWGFNWRGIQLSKRGAHINLIVARTIGDGRNGGTSG